jgi:hypothetical protein
LLSDQLDSFGTGILVATKPNGSVNALVAKLSGGKLMHLFKANRIRVDAFKKSEALQRFT